MRKIAILVPICLILVAMVASCNTNHNNYPPPGGTPYIRFQNHVELRPGQIKSIDVFLTIRKPAQMNVSYGIFVARKVEQYSPLENGVPYEKLSTPPGLEVTIKPSDFIAYPGKTHTSVVEIKTSSELPQGEYQLFLEVFLDNNRWPGSGWITVNVK